MYTHAPVFVIVTQAIRRCLNVGRKTPACLAKSTVVLDSWESSPLDRDAFQDLARSARSVCAPRPREPGSHVIMADVAEKKRFEVKKVRTARVRRFSRGAARIFPAPCPKPKSRARSFARRDAPTTSR